MDKNLAQIKSNYEQNGYVSGLKVIDKAQAAQHQLALETAEEKIGTLHYKPKIHTLLKSPYELVTLPSVLDIVEQFIGHDILLYNVTYIIKEPGSNSHVSWHQDLTYWGLSHDDQVSMWLALSPATKESGCMRMAPAVIATKPCPIKTPMTKTMSCFRARLLRVSAKKVRFCVRFNRAKPLSITAGRYTTRPPTPATTGASA